MADALEQLQELGFTEYEARAYHALLQYNPVSGYELAKVSGIPRANIYVVLQKLEERGAVIRAEDGDSTHYLPVAPDELLDAMAHRFEHTLDTAKQSLRAVSRPDAAGYVWHIQGYEHLLAHARAVLKDAKRDLLVAIWPDEARALAGDFADAEARAVDITTLCLAACPAECGGCRGRIFRNKVVDTQDSRWLMLVPDEETVLVGEVTARGEVSTVRSRQRLLVNMTAWFIRHSIALAVMLQEIGAQLDAHLTPQTRAALAAVGPKSARSWLAYMRDLLSSGSASAELPSGGKS
ncbi:MAG: TrmB family transcriptional regulator [Caldilineaceae bacterium]|nr:TrmB family transcriptional regulator [Caldilineaceae bacterium]